MSARGEKLTERLSINGDVSGVDMRKHFSAWRAGALYYVPLLVLGFGAMAYMGTRGQVYLGMAALLPGLYVVYFFRDPQRRITSDLQEIVSPADGVVVEVTELEETPYYDGPCIRISIFLSIFNVHVNRMPDDGTIARMDYRKGKYKNAMSVESSEVNEANTIWLKTPHGPMTVRQIAGLIARRIVCAAEVGETLKKGEKFGMIRFGSRTELFLSVNAEVVVSEKDKVRGGSTVVARFS